MYTIFARHHVCAILLKPSFEMEAKMLNDFKWWWQQLRTLNGRDVLEGILLVAIMAICIYTLWAAFVVVQP